MRKTLNQTNWIERNGLRMLAAVTLAGSLAAFGCSMDRTPTYGQPGMSTPAAGSVAPNATSTPGSANTMGSMPLGPTPHAMISSSPANGESASLDALATLKADEGYRGKVLGPAAPGDNSVPSASMQQTTGQFISPSVYANPQSTVNSSISSAPTPAIVSGAAGDTGGVFVAGATALPATTAAIATGGMTANAAINGVQNVGVTGVSSATATPITNTTAGVALAPGAATNAVATPILTTIGPLGQVNAASTATGGSVLGVTNVAPRAVTATPTVSNMTANGTLSGSATMPVTSASATSALAVRARAVTSSSATGLRIVTTPSGAVVVTNQSGAALQQFISGRSITMSGTSGTQKQ